MNGGAFVLARVQDPLAVPSSGSYFGGIEYNPNLGGTRLNSRANRRTVISRSLEIFQCFHST